MIITLYVTSFEERKYFILRFDLDQEINFQFKLFELDQDLKKKKKEKITKTVIDGTKK